MEDLIGPDAHVEIIARPGIAAVPGINRVEIETHRVRLAGAQIGQRQGLRLVAEAAGEAGEIIRLRAFEVGPRPLGPNTTFKIWEIGDLSTRGQGPQKAEQERAAAQKHLLSD